MYSKLEHFHLQFRLIERLEGWRKLSIEMTENLQNVDDGKVIYIQTPI